MADLSTLSGTHTGVSHGSRLGMLEEFRLADFHNSNGLLCAFLRNLQCTVGDVQDKGRRTAWERTLVQFQCRMFVASWTGVVRYHGPRPVNRPNNVWVCNHTSMIDYIILTSYSPFAVIMQLHAGWIAFLQTRVLSCLGCLWFNRNEVHTHDSNRLHELCHVSRVYSSHVTD